MTLVAPEWANEALWTSPEEFHELPRSTKIVMRRTESNDTRNLLLMRISGWSFVVAFLAAVGALGAAVVAFSQMYLAISLALFAVATGAVALLMREATKPEPETNIIHYPESMDALWNS